MTFWRRLVGLDFEPRETAWAIRELQQRAAEDPEVKPAKVLYKRCDPTKVTIWPYRAKLLRLKRQA